MNVAKGDTPTETQNSPQKRRALPLKDMSIIVIIVILERGKLKINTQIRTFLSAIAARFMHHLGQLTARADASER